MNYVKSFNLFGVDAAQIPCITGSGAPTTTTEGAVGCFYMDEDTGNVYKCTSVSNGVYTWASDGGDVAQMLGEAEDTAISQKAATEQFVTIERDLYPIDLTGTWSWLSGGVNTADGAVNTLQHRIHVDYIELTNLSLYIPDGFWGIIYYYTDNKKYITSSGKQNGLVRLLSNDTPENAKYFRMMYAYDDSRTIDDIESISATLVVRGRKDDIIEQTMGYDQNKVISQKATTEQFAIIERTLYPEETSLEWQIGGLNTSDASNASLTTRIRTYYTELLDLSLSVPADCWCNVFYFDAEKAYIHITRNTRGIVRVLTDDIPENAKYFRLVVGYDDNRTIDDTTNVPVIISRRVAADELALRYSLGAPNSSNGTLGRTGVRIVSDLTPIQEVFLKPDDGVKIALYYYTADGAYLGMVSPGTSPAMLMEFAPGNAAYFRVTVGDVNNIDLQDKIQTYANKLHAYFPTNAHHFNNFRKSIMANVAPAVEYQNDVPENIGVLNAILNMKQMAEIKYTPLANIPQQTGDFKAGVERIGLPYSSTRPESLFVPGNVSFHTFMTAIQNPNSYLYTVDLGELGNQNGHTYYGAVCSTACGYALGILPNYSTHQWPYIPGMEIIENQSAYGLKLCDTIVGSGHVVMVTDITRNKRGKIGHITISEAAGAKVQSTNYTPEELETRFPPETYKYCRYTKLYAVKHEQNEYVAVEDETPQTVTYNTAIIPRKGDKANWLTSQDVVIDVLEIGSYTSVEIYKDNVLLETKAIASVITLSGLSAGSYKARLTDGTNTSDWCYWIVVDATSYATKDANSGEVSIAFHATNATPMWVQWVASVNNGTVHIYALSEEEKNAGSVVYTYDIPGSYRVRVAFQTEYGIVHSVFPDDVIDLS